VVDSAAPGRDRSDRADLPESTRCPPPPAPPPPRRTHAGALRAAVHADTALTLEPARSAGHAAKRPARFRRSKRIVQQRTVTVDFQAQLFSIAKAIASCTVK